MERHLSTGVATIVALMAAHRAASAHEEAPVIYCQEGFARISAYLYEDGLLGHKRRAGRADREHDEKKL